MMNKAIMIISNICLLVSSIVHAQPEPETTPKWYQVELFIFANNNLDAANQERWNQDLGLKYPHSIVSLAAKPDADARLPVVQDDVSLSHRDGQAPVDNDYTQYGSSHNDQQSIADTEQPGATAYQQPLMADAVIEQAFTLLEPEQHQLTTTVNRILSKADFRLLFHQAWRQPIRNNDEAENILIRAGDQFDSHYELEGTIKLSVERYLHINTDLWLSTFVSNIGREQELWPVLPRVPVNMDAKNSTADLTVFDGSGNKPALHFESPFVDITGKQYSVDRTVALRQHRRMRSNELHYIDHPLMGLLIKITPYELPAANTEDSIDPDAEAVTSAR